MHSVCVVQLLVTVNYKKIGCCAIMLYGKFVTGNNENDTYRFLKDIIFELICTHFTRYI